MRARPEGTVNKDMISGGIEVFAHEIEIFNAALTPPFMIDEETVNEEVRLKYRYLDLRRPMMAKNLQLRAKVSLAAREYLNERGFLDSALPQGLNTPTPFGVTGQSGPMALIVFSVVGLFAVLRRGKTQK